MKEMGRSPNYWEAVVSWFQKAADQGAAEAQNMLGILPFAGNWVPD